MPHDGPVSPKTLVEARNSLPYNDFGPSLAKPGHHIRSAERSVGGINQ
jgi:hypothetical protein